MSEKKFQTPLGRVRSLGSAKHGVQHWWGLRLTSLALIPLCIYFLLAFFGNVVFASGYNSTIVWLRSPFTATMMILLVAAGFHHAANGLQEVIEDYVHSEGWKLFLLLFTKFLAVLLALTGILSVLKILLIGA